MLRPALVLAHWCPTRVYLQVQAVAVDTIAKLAKSAGAEQVRPHLEEIVVPLLESLSSLEVGLGVLGFERFRVMGARAARLIVCVWSPGREQMNILTFMPDRMN
jgi:hypothetical protein